MVASTGALLTTPTSITLDSIFESTSPSNTVNATVRGLVTGFALLFS